MSPAARALRRRVAATIAIKLLLLAALYAFFAPSHRPPADPSDVANRILPPR